jgi:tetratricopeptide (TPR) repeat protein
MKASLPRHDGRALPGKSFQPSWNWHVPGLALGLIVVTIALYWPVGDHEFITAYDDQVYVTENAGVTNGLTWQSAAWAFQTAHASNWHPVTWLSHMLDYQLWGPAAGCHHLTNVAFHALNAAILLLLLQRLTGRLWPSAMVAALFAWHPLHVQSVAWVAERKDLLSTFWGLLSLLAFVRYAQKRPARTGQRPDGEPPRGTGGFASARFNYCLSLALFALGLMSKPMLVTIPLLLLLLDYWPLQRFSEIRATRLLAEKLPFMALSIVSCVITLRVQGAGGSIAALSEVPVGARIANALVSYLRYLGKTFWPADLAILYPYVHDWPAPLVISAALFMVAVSGAAFALARRMPSFVVGWLWYVVALVPVIGLVQVGEQSMADRYTYLPLVGVFLVFAWGGAQLMQRRQNPMRTVVPALAVAVLVLCLLGTRHQLPFWRNNVALFERAVKVTENNGSAHKNLGGALVQLNRLDEAVRHYETAIAINPADASAHSDLGTALARMGRVNEAVEHFHAAIQLKPNDADLHFNLGNAWMGAGQAQDAAQAHQRALDLDPVHARAHHNLAITLSRLGRLDEALAHARAATSWSPGSAEMQNTMGNLAAQRLGDEPALMHFRKAAALAPHSAEAHFNLGSCLLRLAQTNGAIAALVTVTKLDAGHEKAHALLAEVFALTGNYSNALPHCLRLVQVRSNHSAAWNNLGTCWARLGRLEDAADCFARATALDSAYVEAFVNRAGALAGLGRLTEAAAEYEQALRTQPEGARLHHGLARLLHQQGREEAAVDHFLTAAQCAPQWPEALNDAAWMLATSGDARLRNSREAVRLALEAKRLTGGTNANVVGTLAAAYAADGRQDLAVKTAEQAAAMAEESGLRDFAARVHQRLKLYRAGNPFVGQP